jgi:hypothetical protein
MIAKISCRKISYGEMSGTSMASPYCAAGLMLLRRVRHDLDGETSSGLRPQEQVENRYRCSDAQAQGRIERVCRNTLIDGKG